MIWSSHVQYGDFQLVSLSQAIRGDATRYRPDRDAPVFIGSLIMSQMCRPRQQGTANWWLALMHPSMKNGSCGHGHIN